MELKRSQSLATLLFVSLAVIILFSVNLTFATEPASEDVIYQEMGWVEAQCSAPEGYNDRVSVVITNQDTYKTYTITCAEDTRYAGWVEVPIGRYMVTHTSQSYDELSYTVVADLTEFNVVPNSPKAVLINLTVTKNEEEYIEEEYIPDETTSTEESESEDPSDATSSANDDENVYVDVMPTTPSETSPSGTEPAFENDNVTVDVKGILQSIIGATLFLGAMAGLAIYFVKKTKN